jgi:lysine-specific demethylase 8
MTRFDDYIDWAFADAAEQEVVKYYAGRVNFNLLPETLRSDIEQPPFLPDPPAEANLWMGRPTTRSGLHWDPTIGLLAQVRGRKRVKLIPPDEWPRLHGYPHRHGPNSRARMQDADEAFPLPFDLETWEAELHPGDMLYIPPGWWHDLESLDAATISVNFWWQTSLLRQLRISNIRRMVLIDAIHAARSSVRRLGPRGSPKSGQSGSHETRPVKERDPGR